MLEEAKPMDEEQNTGVRENEPIDLRPNRIDNRLDMLDKRLDDVRRELSTEIGKVRTELSAEINDVRKELSADFKSMDSKMNWIIGLMISGFVTIIVALVK